MGHRQDITPDRVGRLAYPVNEACHLLGVGRTSLYALLAAGSIRRIRIAGRVLIPRSEIERLIAEAAS